MLDCYLQKNLKSNGGLLDEVRFLVNTDNEYDLAWLDELVSRNPEYRRLDGDRGFTAQWTHATEPDT